MQLSTYLCVARGRLVGLASAIDMSPAYLSQIANGTRPAQAAVCVAIERATRGEVTRRDLRPCDWHLIWPELVPAAAPPTRVHHGLMRPKSRMIPAAASLARLQRIRRIGRASAARPQTRAPRHQVPHAGLVHSNDEASVRAHQNRR